MAKITINLSRPVRVNLDAELSKRVEQSHGLTDVLDLPAGVQQVDEAVAEHWFVKAHCEPLPEDPPVEGSGEGEQGGSGGEGDGQGDESKAKKPADKTAKKPAE